MPRSLTTIAASLALVVLGSLAGVAVAVTPASAATDTITSVTVSDPAGGNGALTGDLTVVVDSTTAITALTAHLVTFDSDDPTDYLDPALTETGTPVTLSDGDTESTWSVAAPITTDQLAVDPYQVNLDATFADGSTTTVTDAGVFSFVDELTITATASQTQVSYADQTVTVTGSVTSLAPGATAPAEFANSSITMASSIEPDVTIPTDGSGEFTVTLKPHNQDWVEFEGNINSGASGQSNTITFTAQLATVQVTAALSASTVTYGGKVTATGTVSYEPGTSFVPLPDYTVDIYDTQNPYAPAATATTNSLGTFSVVLPAVNGDTTWTFEVPGDPYLDPASVTKTMAVNLPVGVTFHATLNQYWQLSYGGCVDLTSNVPGDWGVRLGSLVIQYAAAKNGPWHTLTTGYTRGGACGTQGWSFKGTTTTPENYAYYRAYFSGAKSDGGVDPGYTAAASAAVLDWKYADRITGLKVSPTVVNPNGKVTIQGQLQYYYGGWHDFKSQVIYIIFRQKGSSSWYWVVKVKTSSTGHFSATVKDWEGSSTWSAAYDGSSTHLATSPAGVYVRVR
jgi:hypothetical protein